MSHCFKICTYLLFIISSFGIYGQNSNCANATPFCTGQTMQYPASTNAGQAQTGPYYGCLFSQPNPAWFFMQINTAGSMSIAMSAAQDIDFICWGPFPSLSGACANLTQSNMQSCSYSGSATETCTIANAVAGQFYLMLITNFSNSVQNITFNQTNAGVSGAASTNCGFVCVVSATNSGIVCTGGAVTLSLTPNTSSAVTSYTWSGPNSYSSTSPLNFLTNLQSGGIYSVTGTANSTINGVPYSGTCQATTSITVVPFPTFSITPPSYTICQGGSHTLAVSMPFGPYGYTWTTTAPGLFSTPTQASTGFLPSLLPPGTTQANYVFSVVVSPTIYPCPTIKTSTLVVLNPAPPVINQIPGICDINNPVQLNATPGGGTWSANPAVNSVGIFNPALAAIGTQTVKYTISTNSCQVSNTNTLEVSKFNSAALSSSVGYMCSLDAPLNLMNIVQNTLTGRWSGTLVANNVFYPGTLPTGTYNLTYNTRSQPDSMVCPANTVMVVQVFSPPIPLISAIPPRCTNASSVVLTAVPPGGVWFANSGVTMSGIQTPSLCNPGSNTVTYTAGQGTCVASSSRTFHVSQYRSAAITGTVPEQCFTFGTFDLMTIVQNTLGGSWSISFNGGVSHSPLPNHLFNPSIAPVGTSYYNLKYRMTSTPNASLCPDSTNINVSVLHPPNPKIKLAGPFCTQDGTVQLSVNPSTGTWIPSNYITAGGMFSPSLTVPGNNPVHYVVGTNTCNIEQSIIIQTEAFVSAAITGSIGDQCTTGPLVNLSPLVSSTSGHWTGQGVIGTNFSPSLSGAGLHTIVHSTSSYPSGLCPDQASLAIQVYSLAPPVIHQIDPICNIALPKQLDVVPVGGVFASGVVDLVSNNGVINPARAAIGNNIISYSVMVGPCIAYSQSTIEVVEFVSADFAKMPELAYCKNGAPFNLNSLAVNPTDMGWTGPGVIENTSMFNPKMANIGDNNYIVHQTYSNPYGLLCPDSKTIQIRVKDVPGVDVDFSPMQGCAPLKVSFTPTTNTTGKGMWSFSDGSSQEGTSFTKEFTAAGSYSMVYTFTDDEAAGCSTQVSLKTPLNVYQSPNADFSVYPDEIFISDANITLNNQTSHLTENTYTWTIQGFNSYDEVHPNVTLPQVGNYKITLEATNLHNCKSETYKFVEVKNDFNVFIPNSFTPNADGLNDVFGPVFSPYGLDAKTYQMDIFDRWGKVLFSTKDFTKGWDGGVEEKGDNPTKQDSFVYKIKFKDLDGRVYEKTGNVLLLFR